MHLCIPKCIGTDKSVPYKCGFKITDCHNQSVDWFRNDRSSHSFLCHSEGAERPWESVSCLPLMREVPSAHTGRRERYYYPSVICSFFANASSPDKGSLGRAHRNDRSSHSFLLSFRGSGATVGIRSCLHHSDQAALAWRNLRILFSFSVDLVGRSFDSPSTTLRVAQDDAFFRCYVCLENPR